MRLIEGLDRDRRVTAVPYQKPGTPESAGLTVEECRAAAWAVSSPDGRRHRGAGAINAAVWTATGVGLPYRLYALPGIRQAEDVVYGWIARNRGLFPADRPYCEQHPDECR